MRIVNFKRAKNIYMGSLANMIVDSGSMLFGLPIIFISRDHIYMKKSIRSGFEESMPGLKKSIQPGFEEEN